MPSDTGIQTYLDAIHDAVYGAQVRTAIYNAISTCYSDVSSGVTRAENAIALLNQELVNARNATTAANAAAQSAEDAEDEFDQAKTYYQQAYSLSNTYIQQMDTKLAQAAASVTQAQTSESNAASYSSSAQDSLAAVRSIQAYIDNNYNAEEVDGRLDALENLETTLNGIANTTRGYMTDAQTANTNAQAANTSAQSALSSVNSMYNTIAGYDIPSLTQDIASLRIDITRINTLSGIFDDYNNTFSGYANTFSGYAQTFSGYNRTFLEALDSISQSVDQAGASRDEASNIRDEVVNIKSQIDAIGFDTIAANANAAIAEAETSLNEIQAIEARITEIDLDTILDNVQAASQDAASSAERAESAVGDLEDSITAANTAAASANSKVTELTTLQTSLTLIQSDWDNRLSGSIQSNLNAIAVATQNANSAATSASQALDSINTNREIINAIPAEWSARKTQMDEYLVDAATALTNLDNATDSIENMTVTSESVPYTTPGSAEITDIDGHKNIHFLLQKGEPGPGNIIKGPTYSSLSDLQADVTDPDIGDQYSIGTSTPYDIYRWTGSSWENQGPYGVSVDHLTNNEIDTIYSGGSVADIYKYLNGDGLKYFVEEKLSQSLAGKVSVVSGKGLSTNDFTNEYKNKVDSAQTSITVLQNNKVDVVPNMGLSTNDFSNAYRNQITTNANNITSLTSGKLNSDFSGFNSFNGTEWSSGLFAVNYGSAFYKMSGSELASGIASVGNYVQGSQIASRNETISYLGL